MLAGKRYNSVTMSVLLVLAGLAGPEAYGQAGQPSTWGQQDMLATGRHWLSHDLHLTTGTLLSSKVAPGQHLLLCQGGFTMAVGGRQYTSKRGLVWIARDGSNQGYQIQVYLSERVSGGRGDDGSDVAVTETVLERGQAVVIKTNISGEVFVTADTSDAANPRKLPLYKEAMSAFAKAGWDLPPAPEPQVRPAPAKTGAAEPNKPAVGYTINIAPLTEVAPKFERTVSDDGQEVITFIGRMYVWWEQPAVKKTGPLGLMEIEADSLVLWRKGTGAKPGGADLSAGQEQGVSDIYVTGNVVFRQGQRTIRATDMYYDLQNQRAVANDVVFKTFDPTRDVPIYIRAKQLRQMGVNEFEGDEIVVTTSEFWKPQISLEAARIRLTDETQEVELGGMVPDSTFSVEMKDVRFRYGNVTLLALPKIHANRERPDLPIRSIHGGYDSAFGASLETRWYLNRLLGLREPEGTNSTLSVDYYGKRGPGGGVEVDYERENYFGKFLGYVIDDHGEDRLSRTRKDVDVPEDLRGRVLLQHRQYLPYGWQLTAEVSYLSDQNFLEQFYRTEYNVGKEQETLLYLKRIQDNWGLAFLGKVRTNDFLDQVEELPSAEYHLTGQSLFDDLFTFYSDSQVSQYRYRTSSTNPTRMPDDYFLFTGTRNELDLPLKAGAAKIVPFVAGTFGYDDGTAFQAGIDNEPATPENAVWIGEGGVRMSTQPYWCVYPQVQSRLWDLYEMRHVIAPTVTAVKYVASDVVADQRDVLDFQIAQRWQTKRGLPQNRRTVDWLELNTDFVWVNESNLESTGPDYLTWNTPFIPLVDRSARMLPPRDRRSTDLVGPRQNYASLDGVFRMTDATSFLGGTYAGMQTGTIEQTDVGFSRLCWPDLSYYLGLRYLRQFTVGSETKSSNAVTFAITYILDPRYTLVFSNQYDYGFGANIATDLTLIRKYHRMNLALTFSVDGAQDEKRVVLGLWPEGVPELALGLRRYMGIGASDVYN